MSHVDVIAWISFSFVFFVSKWAAQRSIMAFSIVEVNDWTRRKTNCGHLPQI